MKVLMINLMPLTGSGSGVYCENIANSLVRQGHEVAIIFIDNLPFDDTGYPFKCHPIYFRDEEGNEPALPEGCDANVLPFNFPCLTTHPRSTFNYFDMTDEQLDTFCDAFRQAIAQEIEEFKPDVIHSGHIWVTSAVAAEFDVPLALTCHGTDIQGYMRGERFHTYAHKAAEACGGIVCISDKNADEARECFPEAADKLRTVCNGYDSHVFYPEENDRAEVLANFGITKPCKKLVSFAGKFAHFKGIDILLRAAAQYEDSYTVTVLAGDGALFEEMEKLRDEELGLQNVYFLHNQPHDMLRRIYNVADVSLAPSRNEPFGLVVIEANACGTPVIGTNDGGIANILTDKTGILIDPEDPDALAAAVKDVLEGRRTFDRKVVAEETEKTFSQDAIIDKTIDVYNMAINK